MKKILFSAFLLLFFGGNIYTQNVGIGTNNPHASSKLDVVASDKGILIPRVALTASNVAAPITAPDTSLLIYNTDTAGVAPNDVLPGYYYWNGTKWTRLIDAVSEDADWHKVGTTTAPDANTDDMFHNGRAAINKTIISTDVDLDVKGVFATDTIISQDRTIGTNFPLANNTITIPAGPFTHQFVNFRSKEDEFFPSFIKGGFSGAIFSSHLGALQRNYFFFNEDFDLKIRMTTEKSENPNPNAASLVERLVIEGTDAGQGLRSGFYFGTGQDGKLLIGEGKDNSGILSWNAVDNKFGIGINETGVGSEYAVITITTDDADANTDNFVGGRVGLGTDSPAEKLDVKGGTTTDSLQVGVGSMFMNMQGGKAIIGSSTGQNKHDFSITFPVAFTTAPKVICTPNKGSATNNDKFIIVVENVTLTGFDVDVRAINPGTAWTYDLELDWFAFE